MRPMTRGVAAVGLFALAIFAGSRAFSADGQGPADANAKVAGLRLGTYWFGQDISVKDLKGKVVLVEIWGS